MSGSYTFVPTPIGPPRFGKRRNWDSEPIRIKQITTIDRTAEYYGSVTSSETGDYVTGFMGRLLHIFTNRPNWFIFNNICINNWVI